MKTRVDSVEFQNEVAAQFPDLSDRQKDLILGMFLGYVVSNINDPKQSLSKQDGKLSRTQADRLITAFKTMTHLASKKTAKGVPA